jgi:hypothetical protein
MIAFGVLGATASNVVGVGHDPDAIPLMRGANGGSGYTVPLRIVPERVEATEDFVQSARAKGCNILDDDVARVDFFDETAIFVPKTASLASESESVTGDADVLAGESSADNVNGFMYVLGGKSFNVFKNRHVWPVFLKNSTAYGVNFAERNGSHTCTLKPERKPTNAGE